jgi:hypothetical protein
MCYIFILNTNITYFYERNINAYISIISLSIRVLDINRDKTVCIFGGGQRVIVCYKLRIAVTTHIP